MRGGRGGISSGQTSNCLRLAVPFLTFLTSHSLTPNLTHTLTSHSLTLILTLTLTLTPSLALTLNPN